MKRHYIVSKHNDLVSSKYSLNLQEQRLILTLTSLINPEDDEFQDYEISVRDYAKMVGLRPDSQYEELEKVLFGLFSKPIKIEKEDETGKSILYCNWLSGASYIEGEGKFYLSFDKRLKPYLLKLKECFTSFKLNSVLSLKHKHSFRVYELLKQYQKLGKRTLSLDEFRDLLGISDKPTYQNWGNLKKKILEPVRDDICDNTDLKYEYRATRKGRFIVGLVFHISRSSRVKLNKDKQVSVDSIKAFAQGVLDKDKLEAQSIFPAEPVPDDFKPLVKEAHDCWVREHGGHCGSLWENAVRHRDRSCYWCKRHKNSRAMNERQQTLPILRDKN